LPRAEDTAVHQLYSGTGCGWGCRSGWEEDYEARGDRSPPRVPVPPMTLGQVGSAGLADCADSSVTVGVGLSS
jgi:hypothetical protein